MTTDSFDPDLEGGCTCGEVRYGINGPPLFVHCCHCRWCQRETGSKQPRVSIPGGVPVMHEYYDRREHWPAASLERLRRLRPVATA